ncbi:hypothetical protein V1L52_05435 [Treponema sp. HNW]|uniref:hypothetical protein n=1 Tax=Treponema sp. HNW TaxID=3116654 RepID=UPI003D11BD65
MKKIISLVLAVIGMLLLLVACPNTAGGNPGGGTPPGEIDYLARLIGTWQTPGYDEGAFIEFTHPTDSNQHCKFKAQWIFTATTYAISNEIKESTITGMPNGVENDPPKPLYGVDANNYYTSEKLNNGSPHDGHPISYEIKNNALYILGAGPLYKK